MTERRSPDPDTLAAPFPGPNPGGVPVAAAVRRQLEEARRTIDPAAFAPNDPLRPPTRKDPDWAAIVGLCTTTLTASKDLHVAARLTEALTEVHGFAGLAAGFRLLRLLVRDGWDHAYPPLEDGPEDRAPPFLWLAEPTRGARFPAKVRLVPLLRNDDVALSWQFWQEAQEGRRAAAFDPDGFLRTVHRGECPARVEELGRCRDELAGLANALADRMGDAAPSLTGLAAAVEDCLGLAQHLVQRRRAGPPPAVAKAARPAAVPPPAAPPATRDEVIRQLHDAAVALHELEPHSPVPHLLFWAIGLAHGSAADAVRELLPDFSAPDDDAILSQPYEDV